MSRPPADPTPPPRPPGTPGGTEAFRHHAPELDVGRGMHGWPLRQVAWALALGTLAALVFASGPVRDWAFNLPLWLGPVRDGLYAAADTWHAWMEATGAAGPYQAIRDTLESLRWAEF